MQRKITAVLAALLLAGCASKSCGGDHYKKISDGHRWLGHIKSLTEAFDGGLALWAKSERERCKKAHPSMAAKYLVCIKPALSFLRHWTGRVKGKPTGRGVLPAIQSAAKAARLGLDAAFDYVKANKDSCGKKKETAARKECEKKVAAWKLLIKPGACALVEIIDRGVKLGAYKTTAHAAYKITKALIETLLGGCK